MRTKFLLLSLLCLITFSCDEDDVIQIPEEEAIELTSTNYIYEGDLRLFYLEFRNTELEAQIEVWQAIPDNDPNYNQAQLDIADAQQEIMSNNNENGLVSENCLECIGFGGVLPGPIGPIPLPCECFNVLNSLEHLVALPNTDSFSFGIIGGNSTILVSSGGNSPITNYEANEQLTLRLRSAMLENPNFEGEIGRAHV